MSTGLALRWWAVHVLGRFFTIDVAIHDGAHRHPRPAPTAGSAIPAYAGSLLTLVRHRPRTRHLARPRPASRCSPPIGFGNRIRVEEATLMAASLGEPYRAHTPAQNPAADPLRDLTLRAACCPRRRRRPRSRSGSSPFGPSRPCRVVAPDIADHLLQDAGLAARRRCHPPIHRHPHRVLAGRPPQRCAGSRSHRNSAPALAAGRPAGKPPIVGSVRSPI